MYLAPVYSENKKSLLRFYFLAFLLEVCIGGSGGLIHAGGLTLRKVNFIIALLISGYCFWQKKTISKTVAYITAAFLALLAIATVNGIMHYGNNATVYENLLMQSFFLLLPFYSLFINTQKDVNKVSKIFKASSVILAVLYLALLALIFLKIISFNTVYDILTQSPEFMGRGEVGFWYKGFIYMCVGLFFFRNEENKLVKYFCLLLLLVAIVLTFVRGFLFSLILAAFIFNLFFKNFWKSLVFILIGIGGAFLVTQLNSTAKLNRKESDRIRVLQLQQVEQRVDPVIFFIGAGFGEGVPIRDNHMEINYLEIFYKQGVIGLLFWGGIFVYLSLLYINAKKAGYEKEARPFLLASIFVYCQSASNPFLTNSIGINVILVSIICLRVLKDEKSTEYISSDSHV